LQDAERVERLHLDNPVAGSAGAIERRLNVFMEKPLVADSVKAKQMLDLAKKADEKNLKVGVGLMIRHCHARQELYKRISDGAIGDIIAMRAYRIAYRLRETTFGMIATSLSAAPHGRLWLDREALKHLLRS